MRNNGPKYNKVQIQYSTLLISSNFFVSVVRLKWLKSERKTGGKILLVDYMLLSISGQESIIIFIT